MLKFLTQKLRSHSLDEDEVVEKVEERDSGTESDDEQADTAEENTDVVMQWGDMTDISRENSPAECLCPSPPAPAPLPPSPVEQDLMYDHHSSEEELEVINGECPSGTAPPRCPPAPRAGKRKWHEDDDDDKVETPVRFRTSPPLEALKPRRALASGATAADMAAASNASVVASTSSPRRRRVPMPTMPPRRHRPQLDFDKMQQLRVRGVRSWRAVDGGGAARGGGELSVFCW